MDLTKVAVFKAKLVKFLKQGIVLKIKTQVEISF